MSAIVRKAVGLTVASSLGLLAVACDEPAPKCNIARGVFSVKYTLVPGSETGTGDCASLVGEGVSVDLFYQPTSKKDQQANLDHGSAAFQPFALTGALGRAGGISVDLDPGDKPYALGAFAETYPKDGFCSIPTLTAARTRLPNLPEMYDDMCSYTPPAAAVDATYAFSNVKVYVKPEANGTQFVADLVYSTPSCSAKYLAVGLYPYVSCGVDPTPPPAPVVDSGVTDMTGMDSGTDELDAGMAEPMAPPDPHLPDGACPAPEQDEGAPATGPTADNSLCSSMADLSMGRHASGINPEFATQCDPVLLTCVLQSAPPSLLP
ncbi:MAG: putative secreted protein [Myxococcaceae bacterium]|nr:putative secreted protein [Myxococcaceae bacterium]